MSVAVDGKEECKIAMCQCQTSQAENVQSRSSGRGNLSAHVANNSIDYVGTLVRWELMMTLNDDAFDFCVDGGCANALCAIMKR